MAAGKEPGWYLVMSSDYYAMLTYVRFECSVLWHLIETHVMFQRTRRKKGLKHAMADEWLSRRPWIIFIAGGQWDHHSNFQHLAAPSKAHFYQLQGRFPSSPTLSDIIFGNLETKPNLVITCE